MLPQILVGACDRPNCSRPHLAVGEVHESNKSHNVYRNYVEKFGDPTGQKPDSFLPRVPRRGKGRGKGGPAVPGGMDGQAATAVVASIV
jgi:hypothetical protein